jgi:hypothetical protein
MEHDESIPPSPPTGPPLPPPPGSGSAAPSTGGNSTVGSPSVPKATAGLLAAGGLLVGLIIGGFGGVVLSGGDDESTTQIATAETGSQQSPRSTTSSTSTSTTSTTAAAPEAGTRSNPFPVGASLATNDGIGIVVQSVDFNGDAAVAGANRFNDPPAPGNRFVLVNVKVTNSTDEPLIPWIAIDVEGIGSANQVRGRCSAVLPDSLSDAPEIYPGGETAGNVCVEVPISELDDGSFLLLVSARFGDPVFVQP